jgi:hypothetical protein
MFYAMQQVRHSQPPQARNSLGFPKVIGASNSLIFMLKNYRAFGVFRVVSKP